MTTRAPTCQSALAKAKPTNHAAPLIEATTIMALRPKRSVIVPPMIWKGAVSTPGTPKTRARLSHEEWSCVRR